MIAKTLNWLKGLFVPKERVSIQDTVSTTKSKKKTKSKKSKK